jgi:hypothetical protein
MQAPTHTQLEFVDEYPIVSVSDLYIPELPGVMSDRLSSMVKNTDMQQIHVFLYKMAGYCAQQSSLHDKSRIKFKWYNYGLSIPAILLSTISGSVNTMSAVSESGDCKDKLDWLNILCGVAGLVAAGMLSVHRFANYAELEHQHALYADSFEQRNLAIRTNILLDANGQNKTFTNLYEYLKHCRNDISTLIEKSPSVPSHVRNNYKTKNKFINIEQMFSV